MISGLYSINGEFLANLNFNNMPNLSKDDILIFCDQKRKLNTSVRIISKRFGLNDYGNLTSEFKEYLNKLEERYGN